MRKEGGENYIRTLKIPYGDKWKKIGWAGYVVLTTEMINDMNKTQYLTDVYVAETMILNKVKISLFTSWRHIRETKI